jgi:hypothetical protein
MTAPRWDTPGRLWSLWEIMNDFSVSSILYLLHELEKEEGRLIWLRLGGKGAELVSNESIAALNKVFGIGDVLFASDFDKCKRATNLARHYALERPQGCEVGTTIEALNRYKEDIFSEIDKKKFHRIADDRSDFVDNDLLFGANVWGAFPSAREDLKASGNCLAAECHSAAVFHLMRVAEIGLRGLAFDRRIRIPKNRPVELATWEAIIKELEAAEDEIRTFPQTLAREAQFDFYHGALMQFRAFKNVFRNQIMHTRKTFDRLRAESIFNQVKAFMDTLASRITEDQRTPKIWKGTKWTSSVGDVVSAP